MGAYRKEYNQINLVQIGYRHVTGMVKDQIFEEHKIPLPFKAATFLCHKELLEKIDEIKGDIEFDKPQYPLEIVFCQIESRFEGKNNLGLYDDFGERKDIKPQKTPVFVFGKPMYTNYLEDKLLVEYEMFFNEIKDKKRAFSSEFFDINKIDVSTSENLIETIKDFENICKKNQPYHDFCNVDKGVKSIFVKTHPIPVDDWSVDDINIYRIPKNKNVKFIHPEDHNKIWHSGGWVDIEWDDFNGVMNGNAHNIPRLG